MADTGTAPAPMTAEDRASEVTFNWALQMPGHELPFCTDLYDDLKGRMAAAIRAAEQQASEDARAKEQVRCALVALNYGGPKGAAWSIREAIAKDISDGKNLDMALQEAERGGAEREREACTRDLGRLLAQQGKHNADALYQAFLTAIRARGKQQEPA